MQVGIPGNLEQSTWRTHWPAGDPSPEQQGLHEAFMVLVYRLSVLRSTDARLLALPERVESACE